VAAVPAPGVHNDISSNTILITGGGSGLAAAAEAFHKLGNQVIITGRRLSRLQACAIRTRMLAVELDIPTRGG